jgi:hypothetical protein
MIGALAPTPPATGDFRSQELSVPDGLEPWPSSPWSRALDDNGRREIGSGDEKEPTPRIPWPASPSPHDHRPIQTVEAHYLLPAPVDGSAPRAGPPSGDLLPTALDVSIASPFFRRPSTPPSAFSPRKSSRSATYPEKRRQKYSFGLKLVVSTLVIGIATMLATLIGRQQGAPKPATLASVPAQPVDGIKSEPSPGPAPAASSPDHELDGGQSSPTTSAVPSPAPKSKPVNHPKRPKPTGPKAAPKPTPRKGHNSAAEELARRQLL